MVGAFSNFSYIYPGPHIDEKGNLDTRIKFSVPCGWEDGKAVFMIFPFNAGQDEVKELKIRLEDNWISG